MGPLSTIFMSNIILAEAAPRPSASRSATSFALTAELPASAASASFMPASISCSSSSSSALLQEFRRDLPGIQRKGIRIVGLKPAKKSEGLGSGALKVLVSVSIESCGGPENGSSSTATPRSSRTVRRFLSKILSSWLPSAKISEMIPAI